MWIIFCTLPSSTCGGSADPSVNAGRRDVVSFEVALDTVECEFGTSGGVLASWLAHCGTDWRPTWTKANKVLYKNGVVLETVWNGERERERERERGNPFYRWTKNENLEECDRENEDLAPSDGEGAPLIQFFPALVIAFNYAWNFLAYWVK